jgi:tryptophan synthase alpha chain
MVREFRGTDSGTPVVLMGYLNPIEVMGYAEFAAAAGEAGVDGVLTVDIPPEEGGEFLGALRAREIDPIYLLAPTSTPERIRRITQSASGFVYYVSLKGVTGASNLDVQAVSAKLAEIRATTDLPVGVGFGIKDAETARVMGEIADAVVVGSALVSQVEANADDPARIRASVGEIVSAMRKALDGD